MVIANHRNIPDILALMGLAKRKNRLGDMKWFVKKVILYIPGAGWGMYFLGCPFLERDWDRDQVQIKKTFERMKAMNMPLWLVSFPEGTRLRKDKLKKSQEFARSRGHQPLERVLFPRLKGFVATIQELRGDLDAVYDVTLAYRGKTPSFWDLLSGRIDGFYIHVKRYSMSSLSENSEELGLWLIHRFQEKDQNLKSFEEKGEFPSS